MTFSVKKKYVPTVKAFFFEIHKNEFVNWLAQIGFTCILHLANNLYHNMGYENMGYVKQILTLLTLGLWEK
jgi:hypothetical protein